jgi:hypothetical protein
VELQGSRYVPVVPHRNTWSGRQCCWKYRHIEWKLRGVVEPEHNAVTIERTFLFLRCRTADVSGDLIDHIWPQAHSNKASNLVLEHINVALKHLISWSGQHTPVA